MKFTFIILFPKGKYWMKNFLFNVHALPKYMPGGTYKLQGLFYKNEVVFYMVYIIATFEPTVLG